MILKSNQKLEMELISPKDRQAMKEIPQSLVEQMEDKRKPSNHQLKINRDLKLIERSIIRDNQLILMKRQKRIYNFRQRYKKSQRMKKMTMRLKTHLNKIPQTKQTLIWKLLTFITTLTIIWIPQRSNSWIHLK